MPTTRDSAQKGTALDLLESEDLELARLFSARGPSVEERSEYGDIAKKTIGTWPGPRRLWSTKVRSPPARRACTRSRVVSRSQALVDVIRNGGVSARRVWWTSQCSLGRGTGGHADTRRSIGRDSDRAGGVE
jgi:hypothetical protein